MTDTKSNIRYLKIVNIFAFLAMVLMNILAEVLPIGGMTTGEISAGYDSIFTPAGITFSIWGVIYLLVGYFAVWQAFSAQPEQIEKIGLSFALTCALNIAWIVTWHYKMVFLSTIIIVILLLALYALRQSVANGNMVIKATFSIYLAWILVASIASIFIAIGQLFTGFAFSVFAKILAAVCLATGLLTTFVRLKKYSDWPYAVTMIWAIGGIMYKHASPSGFDKEYTSMILITITAIVLLVIMTILRYTLKKTEVINI